MGWETSRMDHNDVGYLQGRNSESWCLNGMSQGIRERERRSPRCEHRRFGWFGWWCVISDLDLS